MSNKAVVVGAGLAGTLLAVSLKRRGFDVEVYEAREDLRKQEVGVHRSINLVLTSRGRYALRSLGLEEEVMKLVVPAVGRCIHNLDGTVVVQPYGRDSNEANYSVSRSGLNMHLLNVAEKEGVTIHFRHRLVAADIPNRAYTFENHHGAKKRVECFMCFGADGAGSATRRCLLQHLLSVPVTALDNKMKKHWRWGGGSAVKFEVQRLGVSYKEVMFPLKPDGKEPLDTRYLHIWPRGSHFLMGLANLDGSMTGTLYLPDDAASTADDPKEVNFSQVRGLEEGLAYMNKYYGDAVPLLPNLEKEWKENPDAMLATARVSHWAFEDKICLLGDAAHAVVPFFGQGMNCSFEDVTYLDYVMDRFNITPQGGDWAKALQTYQALRIPAGHAIADMAIENAHEMAAKVAQSDFLMHKAIENHVEKTVPTLFRSRYWMITNTLIPYHWAQELGTHLNAVVLELAKTAQFVDGQPVPDMQHARELIAKHVTPYLEQHGIDLTNPWTFYGNEEVSRERLVPSKL